MEVQPKQYGQMVAWGTPDEVNTEKTLKHILQQN